MADISGNNNIANSTIGQHINIQTPNDVSQKIIDKKGIVTVQTCASQELTPEKFMELEKENAELRAQVSRLQAEVAAKDLIISSKDYIIDKFFGTIKMQ